MKKAYIIVAHKNPAQLLRLISTLNDGNSEFFVHIDKKSDLSQFNNLVVFGNLLHFLKRFDSKWGGFGTIEPFMDGLQKISDNDKKFDRIILLSGQDYPIKSNKQIDEFFENAKSSVFLNYFPIPNYEKWPGRDRGGLYRVDKYYFGSKWHESCRSRALNLLANYIPFFRRKIPGDLKPFTGQTWWIIDSYAAEYVLAYHKEHPEYKKFHRNTFVADELYVQMIIGNTTDQRLLNSICKSEKRLTIWKDVRDAHPKILTEADFGVILSSADLFARKFDTLIDHKVLDMIDDQILFKPIE